VAKVEYLTGEQAIKALRDNVEANGGYELQLVSFRSKLLGLTGLPTIDRPRKPRSLANK